MKRQEAEALILKYTEGDCTPEEKRLVEQHFLKYFEGNKEVPAFSQIEKASEAVWLELAAYADIKKPAPRKVTLWPRIVAIAAAVAVVVMGIWFYTSSTTQEKVSSKEQYVNDIAPGKNGAILTLANGRTITLSDAKTGVVIGKDKLTYNDGSNLEESVTSTILTAITPKGRTYQVTLPDGTRVWLNADSKISFPSQFNGKERKVLLTGEAYFAVVHNANQPFRVETRDQIVEDIGTEFNISAYTDELSIRTTLVEGSAKVNDIILKPSQQSINTEGTLQVKDIDTDLIIAWKNGYFIFENDSIDQIMSKVARWYDVEIKYDGPKPIPKYNGVTSRGDNVSQILSILERTGTVHFKITGRTITVSK